MHRGGQTAWQIGMNGNNFTIANGGGAATSDLFPTKPFTIESSTGNIGIGTTTPNVQVSVRKDVGSALGPIIELENRGGGAGAGGALRSSRHDAAQPIMASVDFIDDGSWSNHITFNTRYPGNSTNSTAERVRIRSNGNVGIGVSSPDTKLDVFGNIRAQSGSMYISTAYSGGSAYVCYYTDGAGSFYLVTCASSIRYKENVRDLELQDEQERLFSLRPVSYNHKKTGEFDIGLIAEEVAETMPELSIYNDTGKPESVKYDRLGVLLLKVVKEQQDRISQLEEENNRLHDQQSIINERLDALEANQ